MEQKLRSQGARGGVVHDEGGSGVDGGEGGVGQAGLFDRDGAIVHLVIEAMLLTAHEPEHAVDDGDLERQPGQLDGRVGDAFAEAIRPPPSRPPGRSGPRPRAGA